MGLTVEKCLQAWTNSLKQMNAKADIVFFGDSLTYYGDFSSVFPGKVVCNLGLRGDTVQGIIDRVEQVKILKPQIVYLMVGINDVENYTLGEFRSLYSILLRCIKTEISWAVVIVQSLLPVNNQKFSISCNNEQIMNCNEAIKNISIYFRFRYVDLFSLFVKDGVLPKEDTIDGIHLKKIAYNKWYNFLQESY